MPEDTDILEVQIAIPSSPHACSHMCTNSTEHRASHGKALQNPNKA